MPTRERPRPRKEATRRRPVRSAMSKTKTLTTVTNDEAGYFAANIAEEFGGGGLGHLDFTLLERELGRASNGLAVFFGRPSGILQACNEEQREQYLSP